MAVNFLGPRTIENIQLRFAESIVQVDSAQIWFAESIVHVDSAQIWFAESTVHVDMCPSEGRISGYYKNIPKNVPLRSAVPERF